MLARTIGFSIRQRWLVLAIVALLCAIGAWSATKLPIDAVPDITNVQVQINTKAEGYSPLEAEQRITYPIETAIAGIPNLNYTRSISRYGLSQVRSEERRVGKECVSTCRSRWSQDNYKKHKTQNKQTQLPTNKNPHK